MSESGPSSSSCHHDSLSLQKKQHRETLITEATPGVKPEIAYPESRIVRRDGLALGKGDRFSKNAKQWRWKALETSVEAECSNMYIYIYNIHVYFIYVHVYI